MEAWCVGAGHHSAASSSAADHQATAPAVHCFFTTRPGRCAVKVFPELRDVLCFVKCSLNVARYFPGHRLDDARTRGSSNLAESVAGADVRESRLPGIAKGITQ
jgi:hypothetical protein